ncbi:MAG: CBS domain-containing protein [Desulfobaccales bacterium]
MWNDKQVKDLMIPLEDYPHIPYWFTLRQAMAIVREAAIKFEGSFEPRAVLVFDEKYRLMGILTLLDIIKGLEPKFIEEGDLTAPDSSPTGFIEGLFGPHLEEKTQRPVNEVMSPIRVIVDGKAPIVKALYLMIKENVVRIPVMEDERVAGMIRLGDLFNEIAQVMVGD